MGYLRNRSGSGKYQEKIKVQRLVRIPDDQGGAAGTWEDQFNPWADITPLKGIKTLEAAQQVLEGAYEIRIRWRTDQEIDKTRRIIYRGQVLTITSIVNEDAEKREFVIIGKYDSDFNEDEETSEYILDEEENILLDEEENRLIY